MTVLSRFSRLGKRIISGLRLSCLERPLQVADCGLQYTVPLYLMSGSETATWPCQQSGYGDETAIPNSHPNGTVSGEFPDLNR